MKIKNHLEELLPELPRLETADNFFQSRAIRPGQRWSRLQINFSSQFLSLNEKLNLVGATSPLLSSVAMARSSFGSLRRRRPARREAAEQTSTCLGGEAPSSSSSSSLLRRLASTSSSPSSSSLNFLLLPAGSPRPSSPRSPHPSLLASTLPLIAAAPIKAAIEKLDGNTCNEPLRME